MTALNLARMLLAQIAILPEPDDGSFWLPPQISTVAHSVPLASRSSRSTR